MKINILPCDIKTVKIIKQRIGGYKIHRVTLPPEIVLRYNLQDKDSIVIAYISKGTEDLKGQSD
jgi:hypothetical protein